MSVDNHRHCQATVLGATGEPFEEGLTPKILKKDRQAIPKSQTRYSPTMFDEKSQLALEWTKENGIAMVYPTDTKNELEELWRNWNNLNPQDKRLSDEKSVELFGMDNSNHHEILQLMYV